MGEQGFKIKMVRFSASSLTLEGAVVKVNRNKSSLDTLLAFVNACGLAVCHRLPTNPTLFSSLHRIRRVRLDLEGVERLATACSSSKGTRFTIAVTWEGAVVQLDPSLAAQGWLGRLSRVH